MSDQTPAQFHIERIYLKDASWESPKSPQVFSEDWSPELQMDINTSSNRMDESRFEVVLTINLNAKLPSGKTAFIAEVQQAALFKIEGITGTSLQQVLSTICPTTLFPYARESLDSLTIKGGFPAPHLAPVNFDALYAEARRQHQERDTTH